MTIPPEFLNTSSLAQHLGYTKDSLLKFLYSGGLPYRTFSIPKKDGTPRIIHAPKRKLLYIQKKIARLLGLLYRPKSAVHGYVKGRGILSNATNHAGRCVVINVDIKDFFPSITFARIFGALKSEPYNIPSDVAAVLSHTCCRNGALPIGSPCSPILANIIASHLDSKLLKVASKFGLYYTRYADDLTLSSKNKRISPQLISFDQTAQWSGDIIDAILTSGFNINAKKIRIQHKHQRQEVTGLTVNAFPNKNRAYVDKIRGALKSWETYGYKSANERYQTLKSTTQDIDVYINGCLAHLADIRGKEDPLFCNLMLRLTSLTGQNYHCHRSKLDRFLDSLLIVYDHTGLEVGTAFLLYGYGIVTCLHVAEHAVFISHWNQPRTKHLTTIKEALELKDLAILEASTFNLSKRTHLRVSNSSHKPGEQYHFGGFPNHNGIDNPNVYNGNITNITQLFQLDYYKLPTNIYGGASGAPLVDSEYTVFGVIVRGLGSDFQPGETDNNLAIDIKYLAELKK